MRVLQLDAVGHATPAYEAGVARCIFPAYGRPHDRTPAVCADDQVGLADRAVAELQRRAILIVGQRGQPRAGANRTGGNGPQQRAVQVGSLHQEARHAGACFLFLRIRCDQAATARVVRSCPGHAPSARPGVLSHAQPVQRTDRVGEDAQSLANFGQCGGLLVHGRLIGTQPPQGDGGRQSADAAANNGDAQRPEIHGAGSRSSHDRCPPLPAPVSRKTAVPPAALRSVSGRPSVLRTSWPQ